MFQRSNANPHYACCNLEVVNIYEGVSKIFRTDAAKIVNLTTKRVWKLPTSTQLRAIWHTDSLDIVVLQFTGALRYHNCCINGGTSSEYFGWNLVTT
jgi:predicted metallopeptidase